jgi:hypothetical protein
VAAREDAELSVQRFALDQWRNELQSKPLPKVRPRLSHSAERLGRHSVLRQRQPYRNLVERAAVPTEAGDRGDPLDLFHGHRTADGVLTPALVAVWDQADAAPGPPALEARRRYAFDSGRLELVDEGSIPRRGG